MNFISEVTTRNATELSIDDVFSNDYKVYVVQTTVEDTSQANYRIRFRNGSGDLNSAVYRKVHQDYDSTSGFGIGGYNNYSYFPATLMTGSYVDDACGVMWVYNPFDSSEFTYVQLFMAGGNDSEMRGRYGMGCFQSATSVTGVKLYPDSITANGISLSVFGVA